MRARLLYTWTPNLHGCEKWTCRMSVHIYIGSFYSMEQILLTQRQRLQIKRFKGPTLCDGSCIYIHVCVCVYICAGAHTPVVMCSIVYLSLPIVFVWGCLFNVNSAMILFVNAFRALSSVLYLFMSVIQACAGLSVFLQSLGVADCTPRSTDWTDILSD